MKKFLVVLVIIIALLFIVDRTILKDKGMVEQAIKTGKLEKLNPDELEVGISAESKAPSFTLNDLDGNQVSLEDYKGKRILLNFWASWCPPCKAEMPDMEKVYEENKDKDFVVLAVNMTFSEEKEEDVTVFVKNNELTFPILMDKEGTVGSKFEVQSYPTSYFIDSDGVIRGKVIGSLSEDYIEKEISRLP